MLQCLGVFFTGPRCRVGSHRDRAPRESLQVRVPQRGFERTASPGGGRVSMTKFIACGVVTVLLVASTAPAAILLQDNFDSYANQAAFVAAWPASGSGTTSNGNSGVLTTDQAFSLPNGVRTAPS